MPFTGVALKITNHFYKNESSKSLKNELNSSEFCNKFPEKAYLCSFNALQITNENTNWTELHCQTAVGGYEIRNAIVIFIVMIIICVSLFGNAILCKIVFFTKVRSATTIFIGNLSISDILMTVINVPIQFISIVLPNWPFGSVMCKSVRFVQDLSVGASSFTMACIALDRYYLIANPLKTKPTLKKTIRKLVFIWILAATISLPYIFMAEIQKFDSCQKIIRCKINYPEPRTQYRKLFTLLSFFLMYVIPLSLSAIAYIQICVIIKKRNTLGSVTHEQIIHQKTAKQKTIKLLVTVLITFALCWLPINIYHIYRDFSESFVEKHKSSVYLFCNTVAMSSVCYNPFIYFWINNKFKKRVKSHIKRIFLIGKLCRKFSWTSKRTHYYKSVQRLSDTTSKNTACSIDSKNNTGCTVKTAMQQKAEKMKRENKQNHSSAIPVSRMKSIFFTSLPNIHELCEKRSSVKKYSNLVKSTIVSVSSCETSV